MNKKILVVIMMMICRLGNTRSYEWNQLKDLKEGETLVIGSKEVEVRDDMREE